MLTVSRSILTILASAAEPQRSRRAPSRKSFAENRIASKTSIIRYWPPQSATVGQQWHRMPNPDHLSAPFKEPIMGHGRQWQSLCSKKQGVVTSDVSAWTEENRDAGQRDRSRQPTMNEANRALEWSLCQKARLRGFGAVPFFLFGKRQHARLLVNYTQGINKGTEAGFQLAQDFIRQAMQHIGQCSLGRARRLGQ